MTHGSIALIVNNIHACIYVYIFVYTNEEKENARLETNKILVKSLWPQRMIIPQRIGKSPVPVYNIKIDYIVHILYAMAYQTAANSNSTYHQLFVLLAPISQ